LVSLVGTLVSLVGTLVSLVGTLVSLVGTLVSLVYRIDIFSHPFFVVNFPNLPQVLCLLIIFST
ncbi:hypothetical protein, partial [Succinatimonas hippei]|uniref:hypothetical protein n=1 Tax=Succinatimonas hippei TaxID=626938 RepID=UPI0026F35D2A